MLFCALARIGEVQAAHSRKLQKSRHVGSYNEHKVRPLGASLQKFAVSQPSLEEENGGESDAEL
jgi:hypothetical protein